MNVKEEEKGIFSQLIYVMAPSHLVVCLRAVSGVLRSPTVKWRDAPFRRLSPAQSCGEFGVMNHAITTSRWKVIGDMPLEESLKHEPTFFKQDPISGQVTLHRSQTEYPTSAEDCEQLERAAVSEPEHAEARLRDHFDRRLNKWVESLRVKA